MNPTPPNRALRFLRWFCREDFLEEIEGDLVEIFEAEYGENPKKANRKFSYNVIRYFRPAFIKSFIHTNQVSSIDMYRNYFKIGWRNLLNHKGYSFINISGLAIGMAVATLIGLWVWDEISYNKYYENYSEIARVMRHEGNYTSDIMTTGMGTLLKTDYGNHFQNIALVRGRLEERAIVFEDKSFLQNGYFMQPEGQEIFRFKMVQGSQKGLDDMYSIILSESLAKKLFNDTDPLDQIVKMDQRWDLKVTGVFEDLPKNSEFSEASYFAPLDLYLNGWSSLDVWDNYNMYAYAQLTQNGNFNEVSQIIRDAFRPHLQESNSEQSVFLHPMSKWHFYSEFENGKSVISKNLMFSWFMGIIGVLVLLLASINFMNLSTARSEKRAKEVGIRKTIGSIRSQLVSQFLTESFLLVIFSFIISIILVSLILPWFNQVSDKELDVLWSNPIFWMFSLLFILFTSLLSGSYPAFFLSSLKPLKVLKGSNRVGSGTVLPRKILVVMQFAVSISLIIGTSIIYQQIQFTKNRPVGYLREALLTFPVRSPELYKKYDALRNELNNSGMVVDVAMSNYPITSSKGWNTGFEWPGKDPNQSISFNTVRVTPEYGKTIGLDFIAGRDFSREIASDKEGIIINESALEIMGMENPVGKIIDCPPLFSAERSQLSIIGVVKDMVKGSPYEPAFPSIIFNNSNNLSEMFLKLNPNVSAAEALPSVEKIFHAHLPYVPFDFKFVDDVYNRKFAAEQRIGDLAGFFTILAILISCMGLFGLAAFVAEQRTKEIGIRKILGASIPALWRMLSYDFMVLVLVAFLIATPVSYLILNNWLQNYEYRIDISIWLFISAGVGTLFITLLTVSYQALKAALINPVHSLKNE